MLQFFHSPFLPPAVTLLMILKPLSPQLVDQILDEAAQLLSDPGVRVHNSAALDRLAAAGAAVDRAAQVARIPEALVRSALETAPGQFDLYTLDGQPAVHYGGDAVHFDPGSSGVSILDGNTGEQRRPVTADFVRWVRLVEALPQYDAQSTAFVCSDVPEDMGDWYRLYLALLHGRKPVITGAFGKQTWWVMYEMLCAAAGGKEALRKQPLAVFDVCPSPPLLWSDLTCQNLMDCAAQGVPAELVSMPLAGAAAPVTLAAAVVQHAAESLSGLVIHQLTAPGAPVVWGGAPAVFDMRTGVTPMGDPGTWLIDLAYIQVGKALGLPTHTYMGSSDAKVLDAQAGFESGMGALMAVFSGANMVSGAGMIDYLRCVSFEKLVLDAEIIAAARRVGAGITPRDAPLAVNLIRASGHKADYLSRPHTLKWFKKEMNIPSDVVDRGSLEAWQKAGSKDAFSRAHDRAEKLVNGLSVVRSPLSEEARAEIVKIAKAAARAVGMEELPLE